MLCLNREVHPEMTSEDAVERLQHVLLVLGRNGRALVRGHRRRIAQEGDNVCVEQQRARVGRQQQQREGSPYTAPTPPAAPAPALPHRGAPTPPPTPPVAPAKACVEAAPAASHETCIAHTPGERQVEVSAVVGAAEVCAPKLQSVAPPATEVRRVVSSGEQGLRVHGGHGSVRSEANAEGTPVLVPHPHPHPPPPKEKEEKVVQTRQAQCVQCMHCSQPAANHCGSCDEDLCAQCSRAHPEATHDISCMDNWVSDSEASFVFTPTSF